MPLLHLIALMTHARRQGGSHRSIISMRATRQQPARITMRTAFAARTARTFKDHSSRTTGTHDPEAVRVQSSRSFMLQRARFIMLLKARRWPVSSQDLPERVIILFTMSNNPLSHDGRGNSLWALDPWHSHREHPLFDETPEQPSSRKTNQQSAIGGARRDRTDDLLNANQALSQLSYGPIFAQRRWIGTNRPQNTRTTNAKTPRQRHKADRPPRPMAR